MIAFKIFLLLLAVIGILLPLAGCSFQLEAGSLSVQQDAAPIIEPTS